MGSYEPLSDEPKINPFFVPEWEEDTPRLALRPWRHPTHDGYYVPVDQTQEAFNDFRKRMRGLAGLRDDGRLVLVVGESGCGKTALIHRCAAWLKNSLPEHELDGRIIDLTGDSPLHPRMSIRKRMSTVCRRLVDELASQSVLSARSLEDLGRIEEQPERVYPRLAQVIDDPEIVLIILLPPSADLVDEVQLYARLARKRLVLFAESWPLDRLQVRRVEGSGQTRRPIVLEVGVLNPADVSGYARDRLTRHRGNGMYPDMDDETLRSLPVSGRLRSIAGLQTLLCGVYEHRRGQGLRYDRCDWVTYQDIAEFVFETEFGVRREPPSVPGMGSG